MLPASLLHRAAIIRLGGAVNERCVGSIGGSSPERSLPDITGDMRAAGRDGSRRVVLVGGEPTMRQDLGAIIKAARGLDLRAGLATNGRMLIYPRLRRRLLGLGVDYFRVTLHGAFAHTHDALVGVEGAFIQGIAALQALLAEAPEGTRVDVACTITTANLDQLESLAEAVAGMPRRAWTQLRLVAPLAGLHQDQWPRLDGLSARVEAVLARTAAADLHLSWEGFPDCVLRDHLLLRCDDLRRRLPAYGPEEAGQAIPRQEDGDLGRFRANSFNYELVRDLTGQRVNAGDCPADDLQLDGALHRHVLLQAEGGLSLYCTPTCDFSEVEIQAVKEELQQLYLDVSPTAALARQARQVKRVRPHPQCAGCPRSRRCCGAVVVDAQDPFGPQERWLRQELSRLEGRTLDVGCGEQPYGRQISALVEAGQVRYHGLDPDACALERLQQSGLQGTLHNIRVEDFKGHQGHFQWVLALRAVNHFQDLGRALQVMTGALRPGGWLLLSDMIPYGLLRTPAQVALADTVGRGRQEHLRNHDSSEVLEELAHLPLRLVSHLPVTPETANEWFLLLQHTGVTP